MDYMKESLKMHELWRGKIEMVSRVPLATRTDLSLAYTPGVAQACLEIRDEPEKAFALTRRFNTVAVVTDGSAVLGLGAGRLCHREKDVPQMKLLGAGLAVIGAILIFLP